MHRTGRALAGAAAAAYLGRPAYRAHAASIAAPPAGRPPNILFAVADDWSWPHASCLGAPQINTPAFDRIAENGVLFTNAFTAAPQCSPCRAATLTGRNIWQIAEAGTHFSTFPNTWPVFPDLLASAGYHTGFTGKGWSPGRWDLGGWTHNPTGPEFNKATLPMPPASGISTTDYAKNFNLFLKARPTGAPFCFWFGGHEPHRFYEPGSGIRKGKKPNEIEVPAYLPDTPVVRSDILDYFLEIEWFDKQLSQMLAMLHKAGELDNTLVIVSSDNGMPFPRAKANLYDAGAHAPMAALWPAGGVTGGRNINTPASFIDLAPTFLAAAGLAPPSSFTGISLLDLMQGSAESGFPRQYAIFGRERHGHARFDNLGYPSRAIRTNDFLHIRNYKPDRWPCGDPPEFGDTDDSPTKQLLMKNESEFSQFHDLAFAKRPAEELYYIKSDPDCLINIAENSEYKPIMNQLAEQLSRDLAAQGDPRETGQGDIFESYPRFGPMHPRLGGFAEQGQYNPAYMKQPHQTVR